MVLAVLAIPLALTQLPPIKRALLAMIEEMRAGKPEGVALFAACYALGSVFTAPIALFNGIAGYVYGPFKGVAIASPANALAATTTFLIGRFALAERIRKVAGQNPRFLAIQRAVEKSPFRIAVLLRLTPIAPQNFLHYGLSITPIRLPQFVAATWVGLLPAIIFQVYAGSLVHDAAELLEGKRPDLGVIGWVMSGLALVATVVAVIVIARLAKKELATHGVV